MSYDTDCVIAVTHQASSDYVVKINGPIDADNAARLQETLVEALMATPTRLTVDLAAVSSIDASGLDVLVGAHRAATGAGTRLVLQRPHADLTPVLRQNGLPITAGPTLDQGAAIPTATSAGPVSRPERSAAAAANPGTALGLRYRRLLVATGASALGDGLVLVAFPLLAVTLTARPVLVAGVAVAGQLPWLFISLPAGALADRVDRRRLLIGVEAARATVLAAFALVVVAGLDSLATLYLVAFLMGSFETAFSAASKASLPELVEVGQLARANGYLFAAETTGEQFAGPALGGITFAWAGSVPFLGDAISFVASAVLLASALPARRQPSRAVRPRPLLADIAFGLKWFARHPLLRVLALAVASFAFCQALVMSVLVLYGVHVLHLGKSGYGLFLAAGAAGNVIGGLVAGRVQARLGPARVVIGAGLGAAAGYLLLGSAPKLWVAILALAVEALAVAIGNVATLSLRQAVIPSELLGRVNNAFRTCLFAAMPLGALAGGVLAADLGLRRGFLVAGVMQVAAVALTGRRLTSRIAAQNGGDDRPACRPPRYR